MKLLYILIGSLLGMATLTQARFHQSIQQRQALVQRAEKMAQTEKAQGKCGSKKAVVYTKGIVSATTAKLMQGIESSFALCQNSPETQENALRALTRVPGIPSIDQSFLAADYRETGQYGPSADGAAGSTQFLHCNKGRLRTFNKTTGKADGIMNLTLDRFFASILGQGITSDPGCVYDSFAQRWYVICDGSTLPTSGIMLAISDNGNGTGDPITPQTVWHYIVVDQDNNPAFAELPASFDYTTIGFDQNYIYCAANLDPVQTPFFFSSALYVMPKNSLVTGGKATIYAFRDLVDQDTYNGPIFSWPAINYDANPTHGFFVSTNAIDLFLNDATQFLISVVDLTGPVPTLSTPISLPVEEYVSNIVVQPKGTPAWHPVFSLPFIPCETHIRNNQLYFINNVGVDATGASTPETAIDRNGIRYYQADITTPTSPTLVIQGALFDESDAQTSYLSPAWISNNIGQLVLGATQCSPTTYLDAIVAQVNPSTFVPSVVVPYTTSTTSYNATEDWEFNPNARWGDHTRVSLDPNGTTFWSCQQWCSNTDTWGLQVAEVTAN